MANTYKWKIDYLDTVPSQNGLSNVVKSCRWTATALDDGTPPVEALTWAYAEFDAPDQETFVAYESLTESAVLDWIWTKVPKAQIEASLDAEIEGKKNPPSVVLPNPWGTGSVDPE